MKTGVTDKTDGFIGRAPILSSWADFTSRPGGFDQYMLVASTYGGKVYHDGVDAVESTSMANKRDADGVATCRAKTESCCLPQLLADVSAQA